MSRFDVLLPVMDETTSLETTINVIEENCRAYINKFIIIISPNTSKASLETIKNLTTAFLPEKIIKVQQQRKGLGGALADGFLRVEADHFVLMASDLETDPNLLSSLIIASLNNPESIVVGNRWSSRLGEFKDYGRIKKIANLTFQRILKLLFKTKLSDLTFGYRIYPTSTIRNIVWTTNDHSFLLESLLKPMLSGVEVTEVPIKWQSRQEGNSHIEFKSYVNYLKLALKLRFKP